MFVFSTTHPPPLPPPLLISGNPALGQQNKSPQKTYSKAWTGKVLEDALRLLVLYAEKQMTLRSSKSDYCPKDDTAAIEATRTVKVNAGYYF